MLLMSEKIEELAKALSTAQGSIENAPRDAKSFTHKYATLSACLNVIQKPLADNGLALTQVVQVEEGEMVLLTILLHTSGQWMRSVFPLKIDMIQMSNKMQALGSVITYSRRYALSAMMGLAQEDDDGAKAAELTNKAHEDKKEKYTFKPQPKNGVDFSDFQKPPNYVSDHLQQFKKLCTQYHVPMADFAHFHKIKSTDFAVLKNAVENFQKLYDSYQLAKIAQADEA